MFRYPTIVVVAALIAGINAQTQEIDDIGIDKDDLTYVKLFPYVVSVSNSTHNCAGSIIKKQHVLTAKQCVDNDRSIYFVRSGSNFRDHDGTKTQVQNIIRSEHYDVAVITLQEPLALGVDRAVVPLMEKTYAKYEENQEVLVLGWGLTPKSNPTSHLRRSYMKLKPWKECASEGTKYNQICTFHSEGRHDVCYGDPGSPLIMYNSSAVEKSYLDRYVQVGLMSWSKGCGTSDSVAGYVNIGWVRSWIDEVLENLV